MKGTIDPRGTTPDQPAETASVQPIWKSDDDAAADAPSTTGAEISKAGAIPGAIAGASAVGPTGGIIGAAAGEKAVPAENEEPRDES